MLVGFNPRTVKDVLTGEEKIVCDVYQVVIPEPYNLNETPAFAMGYIPDEQTRGETFVNFYDNAVPFLEKLIKVNSEADISACKHAFPQRVQMVKACPNRSEGCEFSATTGQYMFDGRICPACHGQGHIEAHVSGLDVIYLPLNDDTRDFSLDNVVKYIAVPIDTLKYQDERIQQLIEMCKRVIYNTDIFNKVQFSDTATGELIEVENMYDTLYTYAVFYGEGYRWQYEMIGDYTTIEPIVDVTVSKDFRLLGKAQLIAMLQAALNASAPAAVINAISEELVYSFYGNSDKFRQYQKMREFVPFDDKTPTQQAMIIAALPNTDPYRVAFLYGDEILKELEAEYEDFYEIIPGKQRELFNAKRDAIIASLTVNTPPQFNFNEEEE